MPSKSFVLYNICLTVQAQFKHCKFWDVTAYSLQCYVDNIAGYLPQWIYYDWLQENDSF